MEIAEIYGHTYHIKKNDEIQEMLTAERDKRNELTYFRQDVVILIRQ